MMLPADVEGEIRTHAEDSYPRECCGLVVRLGSSLRYVPCTNAATTPSEHFVLPAEEFAAAEDIGEILAVVHSHPDVPATPSVADRVACASGELPWLIVAVARDDAGVARSREVHVLEPDAYRAPLIGRPFAHGVLDCWALVRDYYARELGITLPDYARRDNWWNLGDDLYLQHYREAKLVPVNEQDVRTGDIIFMQVRAPVINHAGVYLADGILASEPGLHPAPGTILHHLYNRDSRRDVYGGYWREITRMIVRYSP